MSERQHGESLRLHASSPRPPPRSGRWCAISTGCPTGRRSPPKAASSRTQRADQIGCIRNFRLKDGGRIRERLLALSDYDLSMTYAILESPMAVENYVATLSLTPVTDGDRTFAEWSAEFDCAPEREAELVQQIGRNVFLRRPERAEARFAR